MTAGSTSSFALLGASPAPARSAGLGEPFLGVFLPDFGRPCGVGRFWERRFASALHAFRNCCPASAKTDAARPDCLTTTGASL